MNDEKKVEVKKEKGERAQKNEVFNNLEHFTFIKDGKKISVKRLKGDQVETIYLGDKFHEIMYNAQKFFGEYLNKLID